MVTGYTKYMDSIEIDSAQKVFQNVALPLIGNRIFKRSHLYHADLYDTGKPYHLDHNSIVNYKEENPACLKIKWKLHCYFMFDYSIWFPCEIHIDNKGRLIEPSSIIKTLQNMENYALNKPEYKIKKVNRDPFMNNYPHTKILWFSLQWTSPLFLFHLMLK